ncbi:MAG: hypothetical protein AAFW64_10660, partial [Pseudomonadota bacterium]
SIDQLEGGDTSHAEGTLNLLTGRYEAYRDAGSRFLIDQSGIRTPRGAKTSVKYGAKVVPCTIVSARRTPPPKRIRITFGPVYFRV